MKNEIMKNVLEYFKCLKQANDHNIELYNTKYKDDPDFCLWEDATGFSHIIKKPSCVICDHCTDVWIDPITTEVYHCECGINEDVTECKTCLMFREKRDCKHCIHHKEDGCEVWDCEYGRKDSK